MSTAAALIDRSIQALRASSGSMHMAGAPCSVQCTYRRHSQTPHVTYIPVASSARRVRASAKSRATRHVVHRMHVIGMAWGACLERIQNLYIAAHAWQTSSMRMRSPRWIAATTAASGRRSTQPAEVDVTLSLRPCMSQKSARTRFRARQWRSKADLTRVAKEAT